MYSNCDQQAMQAMGIDIPRYLAATTSARQQYLHTLRQEKLTKIHDYEQQITQIDYLRTKLKSESRF